MSDVTLDRSLVVEKEFNGWVIRQDGDSNVRATVYDETLARAIPFLPELIKLCEGLRDCEGIGSLQQKAVTILDMIKPAPKSVTLEELATLNPGMYKMKFDSCSKTRAYLFICPKEKVQP